MTLRRTALGLLLAAAACSPGADSPTAPSEVKAPAGPQFAPPPAGGNAAPVASVATPAANASVPAGTPVALKVGFTDANAADTHTCSVDWQIGSNAGTVTESAGAGDCDASFTYMTPGTYTIQAAVIDNMGGTGLASVSVTVVDAPPPPPPPPSLPPPPPAPTANNGAVFGEGRLAAASPAARNRWRGNDNPFFAVAAKTIKEGANAGQVRAEFDLVVPALKLRIRGNAATALSVAKGAAFLAGTGRAGDRNGPAVKFLIRAYDARQAGGTGPDKIRIKVWNDDGVLFDTDPGAPDTAAPTVAVERGGIVTRP